MDLINTEAIAKAINQQILTGVVDVIPTVVSAVTKAMYAESPVLKALLKGEPVVVVVDPVKIPPIIIRIEALLKSR